MSADTDYLYSLLDDADESLARRAGTIRAQDKKIREQAAEIERLRVEGDEHARWRVDLADKLHDRETRINELRAALVAAMEIVQKERVRIAYNAKGAPPSIEIGYADILRRLDAVIAQADAAMGSEG